MSSVHHSPIEYESFLNCNTFTESFFECVKPFSAKISVIDPDDDVRLTFEDLQTMCKSFTQGIQERNLENGTRIATICGNSVEYLAFCLGALESGMVVVPINPASKKGEIDSYLTKCDVNLVVVDVEDLSLPVETVALSSFQSNSLTSTASDVNPEDDALVFFSSGTTGPPKAIVHSHRSLIAHLNQKLCMERSSFFPKVTEIDIIHGVLPYFHFGGLMTSFLMLSAGATLVINKRWNETGFLKTIQDYKVTVTNIVPPILSFFAYSPLTDQFDLSSLRRVYVGAAACSADTMQKVMEKLPGIQITQLYGMTEAGLALLMSLDGKKNYETVGKPLPGVRCRIDEDGELEVQTPTMMVRYLEENNSVGDWFKTGDLATISLKGNFSISGRVKDTFKVRGWQVNPWELEEAIKTLPGVIDCAVIGVPYETDGHRPKAFVIGEIESMAVMEFVKNNFISYKRLEEVVFVDSLPRNASGKLLRRGLL